MTIFGDRNQVSNGRDFTIKSSATCNLNACFFETFVLVFVSFHLLDIIPLGLGLLWRVVEFQVSNDLAIFLDHKQELSRTSNYITKRAQIRLTATRRAITPKWIKTYWATIYYQNTYTPKIILDSFPQGYFSGSGLMSHDWPFTLLVSALQPHAAFTCTLCPKCPAGRLLAEGATKSPTERIRLWLIPEEPPSPPKCEPSPKARPRPRPWAGHKARTSFRGSIWRTSDDAFFENLHVRNSNYACVQA